MVPPKKKYSASWRSQLHFRWGKHLKICIHRLTSLHVRFGGRSGKYWYNIMMYVFIYIHVLLLKFIYIYIYRGPCFFENKMPQFGYKSEKIGRMRKGHFSNFKGGGLCRRTGSETEGLFVKSAQKQKAIPWEWYIYLYLVRFLWQM